jgi:integrase
MARMKIRHLVAKRNTDGTARHYWQPSAELRAEGWLPRRLPDDQGAAIDQAELLNADVDAWRKGEASPSAPPAVKARARKAPPGTVSALIADYKASRFWTKLAASTTRRSYEWALDAIDAWAGDQPARGITAPAVQAFYEAQLRRVEQQGRKKVVIETPAKAAAAVRVLRLLLQVGVRLGYLTSNPASRPGISLTRKRDPLPWSPDQVVHMAAVADRLGWRSIGTAMILNSWIGQREGDVLTLPPFRVEAEALVIRQGKTKRLVALPVHQVPHLVHRLKAEAERDGAVVSTTHLLLHDRTGQPWNEHTFRHTFADIRAAAAAGVPAQGDQPAIDAMPSCADLRFMELRHTAVTRLHEAGVDYLGISGITGHTPGTVQAMCDKHYLVRTAKAAEGAFRMRLAAEGGEP